MTGTPAPVRFELGKLGIALHADENEVWFPVSILSSWLTDIAQNRVVCNSNCLYICRSKSAYEMDNGYFNTEYFDKILTGFERGGSGKIQLCGYGIYFPVYVRLPRQDGAGSRDPEE